MKKQAALEDELLLVANSGEIPEVVYHASLYYLTEDEDGPGLVLRDEDLLPLKMAVRDRYRKILLRDLNPKLRDKSVYRGLARSIVNWRRMTAYCRREGFDLEALRREAASSLVSFLRQELDDLVSGRRRRTSINCTAEELSWFLAETGVSADSLPDGWHAFCPQAK